MPRLTIWLTGLAVTLAMALLLIMAPPFVKTLRNAVFDSYQRAAPRTRDPAAPVHVVDIDEASLRELGQWPWPRTFVAELTDRLFASGAVAVGFDILFTEPDRTSPDAVLRNMQRFARGTARLPADLAGQNNDENLAAAIAGRPVVLALAGAPRGEVPAPKAGISFTGARPDSAVTSYPGALAPLPVLTDAAAGLGVISLGAGNDGISRGVPMVARMGDRLMPSLAAELLRVAQGARSHILKTSEASGEVSGGTARVVAMRTGGAEYPLDGNGELRLHFTEETENRMTPAHLVLNDTALPGLQPAIAGRIILVGSSAQGLFDLRRTPLSASVPGVLLQADVLEQVLAQTFLTRPDWMPGLELVLLLLAGLTVTFLCTKDKPMAALIGLAVLGIAAALGGWQAFARAGLLFDPSLIVITGFATLLPGSALGLIGKERMRAKIRSRFAYFVPGTLVDEIAADPGHALTPNGASREMTVMFVDMRRFSTVTEKMSPEDVVRLLNRYLGAVSDAMMEHGATIDKYIGDAIMAFWNAPLPQADHRARALATIFAIEDHVAEANALLEAEGLPAVGIGLGINTGQAFVGLMGSRDRLSYTCVGDSVTQAARFEGLTRLYGTINCVGADTVAALPDDMRSVMLDKVVVKGRKEPVALHTVYKAENTEFHAAAKSFEDARNAYLAREWDRALEHLAALSARQVTGFETDRLADLYRERIAVLRNTDLPPEWDGTFVADSKRG
ncbi:CHASE2 domain-containing protein [Sulfitobacter sp. HI0129]|nr:adenylate/guanylate cyclase domain-containing protein [Sulfitobacter sp. HI0129]KZZ69417.1 hypothetical protein A3764_10890 [Sulfitobacter sp. HI0129]